MINRACGEVSRISTPEGTAEVRPAASFGTILALGTLDARTWTAQALPWRPESRPPALPARATVFGEQGPRPDSPGSPQLPQPRGRVPPRTAPALWAETSASRP